MEENFEEVISLGEVVQGLKKRWKLIFICTTIVAIATTVFTLFLIKPKYEVSTKLFVGKEQGSTEVYNNSDVQMYQQLLKTYSAVIKTRDIAEEAITNGKLDMEVGEVLSNLSVVELANTQILQIKFISKNPEKALKVIENVQQAFITKAVELVPNGNIQVLEEPEFPEKPVSPNNKMNIAIGLILGLMLGIGIALLLEFMDNSFKTTEQLEKELGIPVLGVIPMMNEN